MRRFVVAFAALTLAAQACGGSTGSPTSPGTTTTAAPPSTTTTEPPPLTITSEDGVVTLVIAPDALDEDPGIAITAIDTAGDPDFDGLSAPAWLYEFSPDGLSFAEPVTIAFQIPLADFGEVRGGQVPLLSVVSTTESGDGWELLTGQRITLLGDTVVVSGETTHFSRVAALSEQVLIEVALVEVSQTPLSELGFNLSPTVDDRPLTMNFLWSNGVPLLPPVVSGATFTTGAADLAVTTADNGLIIGCLPSIGTVIGDLEIELLLRATEDTSGETGLTSAPSLVGNESQATIAVSGGLQLVCRPTIGTDGTIAMELQIDHPGGGIFAPNEDFGDGDSGLVGAIDRIVSGLLAGVIRDDDSNGVVSPGDTMYPPVPTLVSDGMTTFVIPLYAYGDYIPYFIDTRDVETTILLPDGATTVLGGITSLRDAGITDDRVSIPWLGDVPYLARVFSDEARTRDDVELVILVTPSVVKPTE